MMELVLQSKNVRSVVTLFVLAMIFGASSELFAQPEIPRLNLTGQDGSYSEDWYPDGRINIPVRHNGTKEIYVPIFFENKWETVLQDFQNRDTAIFVAEPIKSFEFSLLYNKQALEPVEVVTEHPSNFVELDLPGTEFPCDAEQFDIKMDYQFSDRYWDFLRPTVPPADSIEGMALTITGVSTNSALPVHSELRILCYVKFRVLPNIENPGTINARLSPLIIDNEVIRYNDLNVAKERPFINQRAYFTDPVNSYDIWYPPLPDPAHTYWNVDCQLGLVPDIRFFSGMSNFSIFCQANTSEPTLPGVMYVNMLTDVPELEFEVNRAIGQVPAVEAVETVQRFGRELAVEWEIKDPITTDANTGRVERVVALINKNAGTIAKFIDVETSADWLEIQTDGTRGRNPIRSRGTEGVIDYLHNGILGTNEIDPLNNEPKGDDRDIFLRISCDPSKLDVDEGDENGIYTGYITFRSDDLLNGPVRLKVTFIYFKDADEGSGVAGETSGITLDFKNSAVVPQASKLVFGTSERATVGVDSLYGEFARESELTGFGARFYPLDSDGNPLTDYDGSDLDQNLIDNGFGDFNPLDEGPYTSSRDIRNSVNNQSIIYYVKFNDGGDNNYPVVIEWNVDEFLEGAELFIRDTENGQAFPSINMRSANPLNDGRPGDWRSFTIQDQRVTSFLIEYTLPETIEYVDENGDPVIKKGWNFLSLPVKPVNTTWNVMYPNVINKPIFFTPNTYQDDEILREGIGYFMKYGNEIDVEFAGTFISEISTDKGNAPRVYPGDGDFGGWNTIGAVSCPVSIEEIEFEPFGISTPDVDYTLENGVWRYTPGRGYDEVSELLPGLGYWIKVDADGYYKLDPDFLLCTNDKLGSVASENPRLSVYNSSTKLVVRDNAQNVTPLYFTNDNNVNVNNFEMPPVPPTGIYDVRFVSNRKLENSKNTVINLQGVEFPVSLNIINADANYEFTNAFTGEVLGTISKGFSSNITVDELPGNAIAVNKTETAEEEFGVNVYPNPVVSENANINFTIVEDDFTTVSVYDLLGNQVMNVVNGNLTAGNYNETINVSALSSGHYIIRIESGSNNAVANIEIVK